MGTPLNLLTQTANATVADPTGVLWRTQDIYVTTALAWMFTMLPFTILGLLKLAAWSIAVPNQEEASNPVRAKSAAPFALGD